MIEKITIQVRAHIAYLCTSAHDTQITIQTHDKYILFAIDFTAINHIYILFHFFLLFFFPFNTQYYNV